MQLCVDYMTLPSINFNQGTRAQILAERGENCAAYTGVAAAKGSGDAALMNYMQMMQQGSQMSAPQPSNNRSYNFNGKTMNCTTTGQFTNCN